MIKVTWGLRRAGAESRPGDFVQVADTPGWWRCPVLSMTDHWSVELTIREQDRLTVADARLSMNNSTHVFGHGSARRNPSDPDVTEIGEQIAVARALSDLAHMLLGIAATELEDITQERTHLQL